MLLAMLAAATLSSAANASITSADWNDDHDGAVVCSSWGWNANSATLSMTGDQYGGPAHMVGWVSTDTTQDPTLTLGSAVGNDTGFAWTKYQVNVYMTVPFSISGTPTVENPLADDWTVSSYTTSLTGTLVSGGPFNGEYEQTLIFSAGTPVTSAAVPTGVGDELDFNYAIHFSGSSHYAFTQEMIPVAAVPEPALSGLIGGLVLCGLAVASRFRGWQRAG